MVNNLCTLGLKKNKQENEEIEGKDEKVAAAAASCN